MDKVKSIKESRGFKVSMTIIKILSFILVMGFLIVVCLQRFSDNKISFFKFRMFTVISGSMRPKYDIGDVLISKGTDPSNIRVGDAISYEGAVGDFKNKVITHEVVGIEKAKNGDYLFRTQGLGNLVEDPIVSEKQLYGVVIYKVRMLSIIYRIVNTKIGFYLFIIIPMFFIIGSEILATMLEKEEKKRAKLSSK